MNPKEPNSNPKVYVPPNAKINCGNNDLEPPKTEYERTKQICRRKEVKELTKGKYGRDDSD